MRNAHLPKLKIGILSSASVIKVIFEIMCLFLIQDQNSENKHFIRILIVEKYNLKQHASLLQILITKYRNLELRIYNERDLL